MEFPPQNPCYIISTSQALTLEIIRDCLNRVGVPDDETLVRQQEIFIFSNISDQDLFGLCKDLSLKTEGWVFLTCSEKGRKRQIGQWNQGQSTWGDKDASPLTERMNAFHFSRPPAETRPSA